MEQELKHYAAHLTRHGHGRQWFGLATDWDDAIELAETANPGWDVHTCGPDMQNHPEDWSN